MIAVRHARAEDVPALRALLNVIVRAGGTTAIELPIDDGTFAEWFASGPDHVSLFVAESVNGWARASSGSPGMIRAPLRSLPIARPVRRRE